MHSDQCWGVSSYIPIVHRRMQGLKIKLDFDATVQGIQPAVNTQAVAPATQIASYLVRKDRQFT